MYSAGNFFCICLFWLKFFEVLFSGNYAKLTYAKLTILEKGVILSRISKL